jgi:repressor LexA
MKPLTDEQNRVLRYIIEYHQSNGMPPTVREITEGLGYKSPNNTRQHLRLIEQKGYLRLMSNRARGIEVTVGADKHIDDESVQAPIVGAIAAGAPITAIENIDGYITLDKNIFRGDDLFTLRVRGDSMKDVGVLDGDFVVVRQQNTAKNNDIVVALIDNEATLKRYIRESDHVVLRAENPAYQDIIIPLDRQLTIAGKMVGVMRKC